MTHCAYHCRKCGSHFTSLRAFDDHREGPAGTDRACSFPDDAGLVERTGVCKISDELHVDDVTVYESTTAQRARDHFDGPEAADIHARQAA